MKLSRGNNRACISVGSGGSSNTRSSRGSRYVIIIHTRGNVHNGAARRAG